MIKITEKITVVLVTKKSEGNYFDEDLIKEISYIPQLGSYIIDQQLGFLLVIGVAHDDNNTDEPDVNNTTIFVSQEDRIVLDKSIFVTEKRPWKKKYNDEITPDTEIHIHDEN